MATLRALPCPSGWGVRGPDSDGRIAIGTAGELLYDGDVGPAVLSGWGAAVRSQRNHLIVCVTASAAHLSDAVGRGHVVAVRLPVTSPGLP
ncbi:hypothetical protein AFB00_26145 [Pseudonocardia sp. HH130630-07]|nr:hypothetical protein AFB00_26145 [Pseudonocardia sp. HH130630-07]